MKLWKRKLWSMQGKFKSWTLDMSRGHDPLSSFSLPEGGFGLSPSEGACGAPGVFPMGVQRGACPLPATQAVPAPPTRDHVDDILIMKCPASSSPPSLFQNICLFIYSLVLNTAIYKIVPNTVVSGSHCFQTNPTT